MDTVSSTTFRPGLRLRRLCLGLLGLAVALLLGQPVYASTGTTPPSLLDQRVADFLTQQAGDLGDVVKVKVFAPSVQLPTCQDPQPFLPREGQRVYGRVAVGVRCAGQTARVRYLQAQVDVQVRYLVTARDVRRGDPLSAADLRWQSGLLDELPRHALRAEEAAIGQVAVRNLPAGTTLQAYQLHRQNLVERGQRVTVVARGAGFQVSREAKALDNGALGDEVRLRTGQGERLQARVVGSRRLAIDF
ncbi:MULTISPECIES: flagellar basal body P-ring formation chaperone FlgA [Modicisalibacter]|uniref:flagellar basal body P-ring formation chaperone FlgA n=1 Tax=Modicisalibacter TaxID=574347 RepID=UPI00139699C1|nr:MULTISPECIES: flagellar basal body P-ring formation chaperone FlgA [Halomonadaceae]MBZ9557000.1 flagellar basal body P-ring formation protein FlgA [Modicisalibacter sp. R2A 31.J]MBZ9574286.1 flagellar basal body P-ring formation protein FlgA [Modicisalibacter sp. MOD 31.J]